MSKVQIHFPSYIDLPQELLFRLIISPRLTLDDIEKHYKCVHEMVDVTDILDIKEYLETLFSLFNSEKNPLYNDESQAFLKQHQCHSSMSVGDVICIDDRYYVVDGLGFKELQTKTTN